MARDSGKAPMIFASMRGIRSAMRSKRSTLTIIWP